MTDQEYQDYLKTIDCTKCPKWNGSDCTQHPYLEGCIDPVVEKYWDEYSNVMPNCHGCPYWEIACVIDNKIGICSLCMSEVEKKEKANMDILNIFISQPMKGRTEEEILEERKKLMEYVQKFYPEKKCKEINSYFTMDD